MDNLLLFVIIGFFAQMIDGSLGMGYKVSSTTFLLSMGLPPVTASASVHTAGIFTSAVSGYSHFRFGNMDGSLVRKLAIPGIIGGIIGAVLLTALPTSLIKPLVALYLLLMGLRIVLKSLRQHPKLAANVSTSTLGMAGGFFDAIGGGGWGPIVTSTLVVNGHNPRYVIGSVNIAEWFVTMAQAATFIAVLGSVQWQVIAGLIVGGVIAAPLAAWVCHRLPLQKLMLAVGILVSVVSLRTLVMSLFMS
jgi:uncharacterized protein